MQGKSPKREYQTTSSTAPLVDEQVFVQKPDHVLSETPSASAVDTILPAPSRRGEEVGVEVSRFSLDCHYLLNHSRFNEKTRYFGSTKNTTIKCGCRHTFPCQWRRRRRTANSWGDSALSGKLVEAPIVLGVFGGLKLRYISTIQVGRRGRRGRRLLVEIQSQLSSY